MCQHSFSKQPKNKYQRYHFGIHNVSFRHFFCQAFLSFFFITDFFVQTHKNPYRIWFTSAKSNLNERQERYKDEQKEADKTMKNIIVNFSSFYLLFITGIFLAFLFLFFIFIAFCISFSLRLLFLSFLLFYFISDENRQTNANKLISHIIWMNELNVGESTRVMELIKMSMLIGN